MFVGKLCNVKPKLFDNYNQVNFFTQTILWLRWKIHYNYTPDMITCSTLEYQVFYAKTGRDEKAGRRDQQIYINYIIK